MKQTFSIFFLFLIFNISFAQKNISGTILDSATQQGIANVIIIINNQLNYSNAYGYFECKIPSLPFNIEVVSSGYTAQIIVVTDNSKPMRIVLNRKNKFIKEIVVNNKKNTIVDNQLGLFKIPISTLLKIPTVLGERDILKSLQYLPGVQFSNEGTSNLIVRGGNADQNLILLDETPIYNQNHLFGFVSIIPPDAIKDIKFYKAGFPAQYGGRLSSVVDLHTANGSLGKKSTKINFGLITSSIAIDRPIIKNKLGLFINARATNIDKLLRGVQFIKSSINSFGYGFYDGIVKLNYNINTSNKIYLSVYNGQDNFFIKSKSDTTVIDSVPTFSKAKTQLYWGSLNYSLRWTTLLPKSGFVNTGLTSSNYNYTRSFSSEEFTKTQDTSYTNTTKINFNSNIRDVKLYSELQKKLINKHDLIVGIAYSNRQFAPNVTINATAINIDTILGKSKYKTNELNAYATNEFDYKKFSAKIGIRFEHFFTKNYVNTNLQPRLGLRYLLNKNSSIKGSITVMNQYLHLLTSTGVGVSTDVWVPATANAKAEKSLQYALSYSTQNNNWELDADVYYKTFSNLLEYKEGTTFLNAFSDWTEKVTSGTGTSYGAEVFLKRNEKKWNGWLSYSLSYTDRSFAELNNGITFPFKYDRRHSGNIFINYNIKPKKSLSFVWTFLSGSAYTFPEYRYPKPDLYLGASFTSLRLEQDYAYFNNNIFYITQRNNMRMRAHHRLDFSYNITKTKKYGQKIISLGMYNAYGRNNPFFVGVKPKSIFSNTNNLYEFILFTFVPSISLQYVLE